MTKRSTQILLLVIFCLSFSANVEANTLHTLLNEIKFSSYKLDVNRAKQLIDQSTDLNEKDQEGNTALCWIAGFGYPEIVTLLIQAGADSEAVCYRSQTALTMATANGLTVNIKILLKAGAQVNYEDKDKPNPLFLAVWRSDIELVKLFLSYGANINAKYHGLDILQFVKDVNDEGKSYVSPQMIEFLKSELRKTRK